MTKESPTYISLSHKNHRPLLTHSSLSQLYYKIPLNLIVSLCSPLSITLRSPLLHSSFFLFPLFFSPIHPRHFHFPLNILSLFPSLFYFSFIFLFLTIVFHHSLFITLPYSQFLLHFLLFVLLLLHPPSPPSIPSIFFPLHPHPLFLAT